MAETLHKVEAVLISDPGPFSAWPCARVVQPLGEGSVDLAGLIKQENTSRYNRRAREHLQHAAICSPVTR